MRHQQTLEPHDSRRTDDLESWSLDDEFDIGDFKAELNTFMIQHAPANLTIRQAEKLMVEFCQRVRAMSTGEGE